jgi:class 3 adenylate cyclase/tetratricopeptide (TPR) repeat protein
MVRCAACGRENPPDSRFCSNCGAALTAAEPRREERKVVTVLFADMVGFTSRAEHMDPEDVRALLAPYWTHLRDELERFGGTVEKFIGDAVMALFGAPLAHEDDPERAVRAALAIRDWVGESGEELQVRIAVNTGEALVLLGARPAEGEGMAAGDVVNTAARLQSAAPVNGVLVGESTYRATRHVIEYRETEPVLAKGKSEPLPVWQALAPRSIPGVETVSYAPLVGRRDELELLVGALQRVRREREPQLLTVAGVPGIGKSRLVAELYAEADRDEEIIGWRRGRSLSYGESVSLWALGEIVKAELGVLESDSRAETAAKLRASVAHLVETDADRAWLERQLAPLVGLPSESVDRQERFGAWRRWIEALAERRPLVVVFEDLQWADDELLDFVDELAEWTTGVPLLIICTTRPELFERRPAWGGGKRNAATISLGPLDDADTARIVATTLARSVLPAETQTALLARAGGNPLYAEQYAHMVAEGGDTDALPESVHGIVAARLDLLAPNEKALLQDAAVIGRVFWPGALGASPGVVRSLVRKEFVRRERRSSIAGEEEFSFAHGLVRDVAYAQIPRGERAAKHRAAAEWIETLPADRAADRAEMVAHHYAAALELATALSVADDELRRRAREGFREAGERTASLNAFGSAKRHFAAALELTDDQDPLRPRLLFSLGRALFEHEGAVVGIPLLEEGARALAAVGEVETAAFAEIFCSRACVLAGRRDDADAHTERAVSLVAGGPPSEAKAEALAERARLLMFSGRSAESVELATEALGLAEQLGLERTASALLITRGTATGDRGEIEQGLEIAERIRDAMQITRGLNNLAEEAIRAGDIPEALAIYPRTRQEVHELGLPPYLHWLDVQEAALTSLTDAWDCALELLEPVFELIDSGATSYLESEARHARARIRHARDDTDAALDDGERGLAASRNVRDPQSLVPALGQVAELFAREGRAREARTALEEALAVAKSSDRPYYSWGPNLMLAVLDTGMEETFLGHFAEFSHDDPWTAAAVEAWRGDLAGAADDMKRRGATALEAELRVRAAARMRTRGESAGADEQLRLALAFFHKVRATRRIRDAEALLAATA